MKHQPTPPPEIDRDDEIDLLAVVGTLWRGKLIILAAAVACILLGGIYAFRVAVPLYPATVTIALNAQEQQVITDIESILGGGSWDNTAINTELEVLRSRQLIGQLVDRLDLAEDQEFNGALRTPSFIGRVRSALFSSRANSTSLEAAAERNRVIDAVLRSISASSVRSTLALTLTVTTEDPEKSVAIANTLAEIYIENQIIVKLDALSNATAFLSTRTVELRQNLESLEGQLANFADESELISPEVLEAQTIQLRELRARLQEQRQSATNQRAQLETLEALRLAGDAVQFIQSANEFRLTRALTQFRNGQLSETELDDQINQYFQQLASTVARSEQQVAALESSEEELSAQIQRQSDELIELQQLEREAESARLLYESFFTRLQETNVQQGLEVADSRILSEAVPRPASSPRKAMILMLSAVLGTLLGSGIVLLREMQFAGFRTADDLRQHTGQSVLAAVPMMPVEDRKEVLNYLKDKPNSIVSEAIRNLRTSVLMSGIDAPPKVMMVTSSLPGEGKTTISLALCRIMSGMGKKVLLVEADIRRRTLSEYFETKTTVPLLDLLLEKVRAADVNPFVEELGFDVLTGTKSEVNAADLFASDKFAKLMSQLRDSYDYVVIDTPPVLAVPDARVIGANADATIYCVAWNQTTRTQLRQGLDMLESVGLKVNGLVLSRIDQRKLKSYGYGGQYGYDTYASKYYDQ